MIELEATTQVFNPYGGRMAEIPESKIPFPHRARNLYKIQYATSWNQEGNKAVEHYLYLTRELYAYMTPFVSKNPREAFLNCRDLDLGINYQDKKSYFKGMKYGIKYFKNNFYRVDQRVITNVEQLLLALKEMTMMIHRMRKQLGERLELCD
ncbi:hypothetical protein Ancab_021654, partial [Ancistrocladus abbreviatus]